MTDERLFTLDEGAFGITIPHPGMDPEEYRNLRGLYAFYQTNSGQRTDLLELCTLPWPADKDRAAMTEQMLAGMRTAMEMMPASQRKQMEDSIAMYSQQLNSQEQDSRKFPDRVAVTTDGKVLLAFKHKSKMTSPPERILRLIDVQAGKILLEEKPGGGGGLLSFGGNKQKVAEMLAMSGDGHSALLYTATEGVHAVTLSKGLPRVFSPVVPNADFHYGAWAPGRWLINADALERNRLLSLDDKTGKTQFDLKLAGVLSDIAVSADGRRAAVGLMGGTVQVVTLESGAVTTYKPHRGAKRDTWTHVAVSPDGRMLASWLLDDKWVALTDLDTGRTMRWLPLERMIVREPDGTASVSSPGFVFQGNQFVTLAVGAIARHERPTVEGVSVFVSQIDHPEFKKPVKLNKKEPLEANLKRFGLARVARNIVEYWSPPALLKLKRAGKKALPVGSSRLGGAPDLPANTHWPRWNDQPMSFVVQFNLEELAGAQPKNRLPKSGLLSVFLGCNGSEPYPLGIPEERGGWRVLWTPAGSSLQRQPMPKLSDEVESIFRIDEAAIEFKAGGLVLPKEDSFLVEAMQLMPEEQQGYVDLIQQVNQEPPEGQPAHQLLGHPWALQGNDMEMACARAVAGEDPYSALVPEDPAFAEWLRRAAGWQLLLQLDSDETSTNMLWGDAGLYYWFLAREKLYGHNFEETWGQTQCH
ncbi:MAG TPA: hypothetical protein DIC36_09855 [Gammaproteobacteria bacterium]|nr:hypothetical protein [Gammaproteobacteria bacterium]